MNSVISQTFGISSSTKIEIPRTKSKQKLVLQKIHIDKIDIAGVGVAPDNIVSTLKINSWPVLDKVSGTLLSSKPNTSVLNHEFDADDDIRFDLQEIVPTATTDKVILTLIIKYEDE